MKYLAFLFFVTTLSFAKYPDHWRSIKFKSLSTRTNKAYNLEVIEFLTKNRNDYPIILFIPGYFQNSYSWDLLPEKDISLVKYIARKYKFHMFSLHHNGMGKSDYIRKSNLDDIAIDDIPNAIKYLKKKYKKDVFVFGHSNGAITLQASLAGLTWSNNQSFQSDVGKKRQRLIRGIGLSAGNICMNDTGKSFISIIAKLTKNLKFVINRFGWVNAKLFTRLFFPPKGPLKDVSFAYSRIWEMLYHRKNVSKEAMKAIYERTIEGASARSLVQYDKGVIEECIKSHNGENYNSNLKNIRIPVFQMTYSLDSVAKPKFTKRDGFNKIGSFYKKFKVYENQGHEDFMMSKKLHANIDWIMKRFTRLSRY